MQQEFAEKSELEKLADSAGLAIAIVDGSSREIFVTNNNSICRNLNPDGKFVGQCAAFCGTALEETNEVGASVSFTCHAGLECRAVPLRNSNKTLVAIIGRTFAKAENYRKATERAISGDWSNYPPTEFFENILLTGSVAVLDETAAQVESLLADAKVDLPSIIEQPVGPKSKPNARPEKSSLEAVSNIVEKFNRQVGLKPDAATPAPSTKQESKSTPPSEPAFPTKTAPTSPDKRAAEAGAWRSFFGSLLNTDYSKAADSILAFVAHQYNFSSLIWLEKKENRLENTATFGEMKKRKVRLGIASDDRRLIEASQNEMPLEFEERSKDPSGRGSRTMHLFPIAVGGEISAAIAILDPIDGEGIKKQIARICHSIAPQMEILRLRSEVMRGETLATAVRRFSENLKHLDADDLWLNLTQNAAETLKAERASLLIYDQKAETLEIKAMIGAKSEPVHGEEVGGRVAKIVFEKHEPVAVSDVSKSGLAPAPPDRQYKTSSFLSCPISIEGRTIGVINFTDKASGLAFDRHSLELFQAIAPQLAVAIDRASLKEKAGEFQQLSVTDALTGLLNRRYIEERLMEEIKRSNRHGFPMSFMMLDVDEFKSYNDHFGHPAGDEALKMVANVIRETLRGADVAARFGGEEFAILLPQTTGVEARAIAERIRANIEGTDFPERRVTISIGIASCSPELCSSADIVRAADKALYEAKHRGRNRVLAFEELNLKAVE